MSYFLVDEDKKKIKIKVHMMIMPTFIGGNFVVCFIPEQ